MNSTLGTVRPGLDLLPQLIEDLEPHFADLVCELLERLLGEGVVLRPYSGRRGPLEQAVLWCQSRTPLECELMARRFDDEHAPYLARVLRRGKVIGVPGRWATNNLPGQSWHNLGRAIDAHVVSEDGRAVWGPKHASYERYASIARELGLFPGYDLTRQDVVHVQEEAKTVRSVVGPWHQVDRYLQDIFPHDGGAEVLRLEKTPPAIGSQRLR